MKTRSITEVAKSFLNEEIPKDGIICDFTMGGGHDTLYLSDLVPEGKVYAFDIQPLALERTRKRLEEAGGRPNVQLILDSHENFDRYVPGEFDAGMFNLGYLPTSDHVVTTKAETTMAAVSKALERVKVGGTVVVVVYPGHPEGNGRANCCWNSHRRSVTGNMTPPITAWSISRIVRLSLRSRSVSDPKGRITVFP